MEWIILSSIVCCILLFIYKECVVLYIARLRSSGIMLESSTLHFVRHHTNQRIQRLDKLLLIVVTATLLLYSFAIVQNIMANPGIPELTVMEAGMALLLYLVFPTRKITHFITESGLEERGRTTEWNEIYAVHITDETAARRMLHVIFKGTSTNVEGYMYDRDLGSLKQLVTPHSIALREL